MNFEVSFFFVACGRKEEGGSREAQKGKSQKKEKKERCGSRTTCWASHLGENLDKVCTSALRF